MSFSPKNSNPGSRPVIGALCILLSISIGIGVAVASGLAPVAVDDQIVVTFGGTVTTLANGAGSVLDNDSDAENDPLTVVLTRNARRGILTLNPDGTFIYRHGGGRRNSDEFRYAVFDGSRFSSEARVQINVVEGGSLAPQIVGQDPVSVNEDASLSIDIRRLQVVDPDSSFPRDFSLEAGDGSNYTRTGTTITPAANFNGPMSVPVRVFDGSAFSNWYSLVVDVLPQNDAPFAVGAPPDQEAIANTPYAISLAQYFNDIDANDSFQFSAQGLPSGRSLAIDSLTGVLSGTPLSSDARAGGYNVTVTATDSGGLRATIAFHLTIYPDNRADLAATANVSVNPVTVGESAQWNIAVDNLGPADLDSGELVARWSTSGPALALNVPQDCTITANNSKDPSLRCPLVALAAGSRKSFAVQGTQNAGGDNSLLAVVVSDDPITSNNSALVGTQVVAGFSEGPTQILSGAGSDIASADLNGDGQEDLAVTAEQTVIFLNSGKRTFVTPGVSLGAGSGGTAVVILDWNGDSYSDVAVAGLGSVAGRIYINDGKGNFSAGPDLKYANSGTILAAAGADFAGDGFADLVLTGTGGSHLLRSTGQQGFSLTTLSAGPGIDVSTADINNDGSTDILVVESGDRSVRLLRNSGDGRNFTGQGLQRGSVAAVTGADLNGDGRIDLLLAIDGEDQSLPESRILYQRSDGTFPSGEVIGASALSKMLAGDFDGDLLPDIVALNEAGVHQLYRGISGGGFALQAEQIVSAGMSRGVLLDFNGDQSLDLIIAGRKSTVVEVHANNGIGRLGRGDRDAPVIRLNGEAVVTVPAGAVYEDPGFTAEDAIDGDLTAAVVVSGSFNTSVVGSYAVSYSVSDRAGNLGTAKRTINVGINEGVGGGGGGTMSILFMVLQGLILIAVFSNRARIARLLKFRPVDERLARQLKY